MEVFGTCSHTRDVVGSKEVVGFCVWGGWNGWVAFVQQQQQPSMMDTCGFVAKSAVKEMCVCV